MKSNYLDELLKQGGFDKKDNLLEWVDGAEACKEGKPAPKNATESYKNGYNTEYQMQEMRASLCN